MENRRGKMQRKNINVSAAWNKTKEKKDFTSDDTLIEEISNLTVISNEEHRPNRNRFARSSLTYNESHTISTKYYYDLTSEIETVVAYVDYFSPRQHKLQLFTNDYSTLYHERWLPKCTMDYMCNLILKESSKSNEELALLTVDRSSHIMVDRGEINDLFSSTLMNELNDKSSILLPCIVGENKMLHFVLFFVDVKDSEIYCLDSGRRYNMLSTNDSVKRFGAIYGKIFPTSKIKWIIGRCRAQQQKDDHNCGIFLLHFVNEIAQGRLHKMIRLNPNEKREQLLNDILIRSLDVSLICLVCGRNEESSRIRRGNPVRCTKCNRWRHSRCFDVPNRLPGDLPGDEQPFICNVCDKWFKLKETPGS